MRQAIELHDSEVLSIRRECGRLVIEMQAYLHRSDGEPGIDPGTGWSQLAELVLDDAEVIDMAEAPLSIVEGSIDVGERQLDNMVPLPFQVAAPVRLELLGNEGQRLSVRAGGASFCLKGEPSFVESFVK